MRCGVDMMVWRRRGREREMPGKRREKRNMQMRSRVSLDKASSFNKNNISHSIYSFLIFFLFLQILQACGRQFAQVYPCQHPSHMNMYLLVRPTAQRLIPGLKHVLTVAIQ